MNGRTNSNGTTTDTLQIPLDAPSNVLAVAGVNSVTITYTDPLDKYGTTEGEVAQDPQQLVSVWDHSVIVRKVGSDPTGPLDGTQVCSSMIRNQYQTNGFVDMGLDINQTYHYGVFAYNESNVPSEGGFSNCHLWGFDSILANNSWEQINQAGSIGVASSIWEIGDEKDITVGSETLTVVILDFNHDNYKNTSNKIPMTFATKNLMKDKLTVHYLGGYGYPNESEVYECWDNIKTNIQSDIVPYLKTVSRNVYFQDSDNYQFTFTFPTYTEVLGPFVNESGVGNPSTPSGGGRQYPYFTSLDNRIKRLSNGTGAISNYWTISGADNTVQGIYYIDDDGDATKVSTHNNYPSAGKCFMFFI